MPRVAAGHGVAVSEVGALVKLFPESLHKARVPLLLGPPGLYAQEHEPAKRVMDTWSISPFLSSLLNKPSPSAQADIGKQQMNIVCDQGRLTGVVRGG